MEDAQEKLGHATDDNSRLTEQLEAASTELAAIEAFANKRCAAFVTGVVLSATPHFVFAACQHGRAAPTLLAGSNTLDMLSQRCPHATCPLLSQAGSPALAQCICRLGHVGPAEPNPERMPQRR